MYTLKFKDVTTRSYETTFGTCDMCMSTGTATEPTFWFTVWYGDALIDTISVSNSCTGF